MKNLNHVGVCYVALMLLSLGGCTTTVSLIEKQTQIDKLKTDVVALEKRLTEVETAVGNAQKVLVSHQDSLERQGNVNTSLMNITEALVKKVNQ